MDMVPLKVKQIKKAMRANKYIMLRYADGRKTAVNCGILRCSKASIHEARDNKNSMFVSWYPCGLHEYITHKTAFI
jgi:hypothetical protein